MNKNEKLNIPINLKKLLLFSKDKTYTLRDEQGNPIKVDGKKLKISKNDLSDFIGLDDKEILSVINDNLNIDINTDSGLEIINGLFSKAIDFINISRVKIIFERKGVNLSEIDFPFTNSSDIVKFLKLSNDKSNGWVGKSSCFIAKTCFAVNDILNSSGLSNLEADEARFYQKFKQVFNIIEIGEVSEGYIGGKKFIFHGRPKSVISCILKNIRDVECTSLSKLTDGFQYAFGLDGTKKERIELLKQIYFTTISLGGEFNKSNVKGLTKDELKYIYGNKEDDFGSNVLNGISTTKKASSGTGYADLKMSFYIEGIPFEIKLIPKGNINQDGVNFHGVYSYLTKYIEGVSIRGLNGGYIDDETIEILASDFFTQLPALIRDNLEKRDTSENAYLKELWNNLMKLRFIRKNVKFEKHINDKDKIVRLYLMPGLKKYFISKLITINLQNGKKIYTNDRSKAIKDYFDKANNK